MPLCVRVCQCVPVCVTPPVTRRSPAARHKSPRAPPPPSVCVSVCLCVCRCVSPSPHSAPAYFSLSPPVDFLWSGCQGGGGAGGHGAPSRRQSAHTQRHLTSSPLINSSINHQPTRPDPTAHFSPYCNPIKKVNPIHKPPPTSPLKHPPFINR